MESHTIGTGMVFGTKTSQPLSVAEWEARYGGFGFIQDEWWFKAAKALLRWARAGHTFFSVSGNSATTGEMGGVVGWPRVLLVLAALCLSGFTLAPDNVTEVDLQLVLAADVSSSMSAAELRLRRDGYLNALSSGDVVTAIRSGPIGRVAVPCVEWAGEGDQTIVVPWTVLDSEASIAAFVDRLAATPVARRGAHTALSGGLLFSAELFSFSGLVSNRKIIDVSGDGMSDAGPPVALVRERLMAEGITINALSVVLPKTELHGPFAAMCSARDPEINAYFRDEVIGGPGAFAVPVNALADFPPALRRKLVMEIAMRLSPPEHGVKALVADKSACLLGNRIIPAEIAWRCAPRTFRVMTFTKLSSGESNSNSAVVDAF